MYRVARYGYVVYKIHSTSLKVLLSKQSFEGTDLYGRCQDEYTMNVETVDDVLFDMQFDKLIHKRSNYKAILISLPNFGIQRYILSFQW